MTSRINFAEFKESRSHALTALGRGRETTSRDYIGRSAREGRPGETTGSRLISRDYDDGFYFRDYKLF